MLYGIVGLLFVDLTEHVEGFSVDIAIIEPACWERKYLFVFFIGQALNTDPANQGSLLSYHSLEEDGQFRM